MMRFVLLIVAVFAATQAVEKRRDDKWPPPEILETLKPIAAVCKQKTGVTEGVHFHQNRISIF